MMNKQITCLYRFKLVNTAIVDYYTTDLNIMTHFITLKRFLLLEDGEFANTLSSRLFEKVHIIYMYIHARRTFMYVHVVYVHVHYYMMYIFMYMYNCTCIGYICIHVQYAVMTSTCTYLCTCIRQWIYMYTCTCIRQWMYMCTCTYTLL